MAMTAMMGTVSATAKNRKKARSNSRWTRRTLQNSSRSRDRSSSPVTMYTYKPIVILSLLNASIPYFSPALPSFHTLKRIMEEAKEHATKSEKSAPHPNAVEM